MNSTDALKARYAPQVANPAQIGTAIATPRLNDRQLTLRKTFLSEPIQKQIAMALPSQIDPKRFARVVITECNKNPQLWNSTPASFMGSVLTSASLGLEVGSALGQAYLVPYNSRDRGLECQLIIGYRGMIDLARRSQQIESLQAYAVYKGDFFEYKLGLNPNIEHVPAIEYAKEDLTPKGDRQLIYAYAVARLKGGGVQFEVMTRKEIEAHRPKKGSAVWEQHFDEMAKKTVIRRIFKMLPISIELARAIEMEERNERGEKVGLDYVADTIYMERDEEVQFSIPQEETPAIEATATEAQPKEEPEKDGTLDIAGA